jgi:hypothetical protein
MAGMTPAPGGHDPRSTPADKLVIGFGPAKAHRSQLNGMGPKITRLVEMAEELLNRGKRRVKRWKEIRQLGPSRTVEFFNERDIDLRIDVGDCTVIGDFLRDCADGLEEVADGIEKELGTDERR